LAPFFQHLNWENHLPTMYDFWESTLFHKGGYSGNPMKTHQHIHDKTPLTKQHFLQWKALFFDTIDEYFEGDNAAIIKQRALSIATVMELKFYSAP
ncbi:MAG: group III truncated hemoglobin, partial [Ferruginibacter sp.]